MIRSLEVVSDYNIAGSVPVLAVVGMYYSGSTSVGNGPFKKWCRAETVDVNQTGLSRPHQWTLTQFCQAAFRDWDSVKQVMYSAGSEDSDPADKAFEILSAIGQVTQGTAIDQGFAGSGIIRRLKPANDDKPLDSSYMDFRKHLESNPELKVRALNTAFFTAMQSQSVDFMSKLWAPGESTCCMIADHPRLQGKQAITEFWRKTFETARMIGFDNYRVEINDMHIAMDTDSLVRVTLQAKIVRKTNSGFFLVTHVCKRDEDDGRFYILHHHSSVRSASF